MNLLNTNDYLVLNKIVDIETGKGISKLRGVTVVELSEITGFSTTKIRNSLKKLKDRGFIDFAIKRVRSDTFHITELGVKELESIGQPVIKDIDLNQDYIENEEINENEGEVE